MGLMQWFSYNQFFSENARIGVLLEGLMLSFNGSRVLKSSRTQISRIPSASCPSDAKTLVAATWDWVIQGLDVHICLPYRLKLRAIDDSVEEMLRALKLVSAARTSLIFPTKKDTSKPKKPGSMKFGCLKFGIRKLTADIEEEPLQGWLDEHYRLMKNEASELAVRACNNLAPSEGSGACREGFQSGFKPTTSRTSLLSITARDLDVTLTRIDGGDDGMIEVIKTLDPVCLESDIPFSRLYESNVLLHAGSLVVQLRDYASPLLCGTSVGNSSSATSGNSPSVAVGNSSSAVVAKNRDTNDSEEDGTCHFMVNVIEPQFNLHSEDANGRFLLAAGSGLVLARSFHSVLQVGSEMLKRALGTGNVNIPECEPEMTWKLMEFSVMLEYVQAHVAPTDVDPGCWIAVASKDT
ncbi:hypothetical protein COP1_044235 [Malus domestica]